MHSTTILKEEQARHGAASLEYTHAPQFPLELCIKLQNNADSFFRKEYTLNDNTLGAIIMITVKHFRYTKEKVANLMLCKPYTVSNGSRGVSVIRN